MGVVRTCRTAVHVEMRVKRLRALREYWNRRCNPRGANTHPVPGGAAVVVQGSGFN